VTDTAVGAEGHLADRVAYDGGVGDPPHSG